MIVLGVDPGSRVTGYGLVTRRRGRFHHLLSGAVRCRPDRPLHERLLEIHDALSAILTVHRPDVVAVEAIFRHRSSLSALKLGHARGVVLLAAARAGVELAEYNPMTVKQTVAGSGRADKAQVACAVGLLLGTAVEGPHDATDALAVAMTHLAQAPLRAATRRAK